MNYPIDTITIGLGETSQNVDIDMLGRALYEGLTAKNYLALYCNMKSTIENNYQAIVQSEGR